tara:strand:+ start:16589 stop:17458 length:870 start_codon:yes stop_codon:yes gene_type:complete
MNYRNKICWDVITFPTGNGEQNRLGCKEMCCIPLKKIASTTQSENWKNDWTNITIKKSDLSDIVQFTIVKCGDPTPLLNLGDVCTYPQDVLAFGFNFEWKQYLDIYGAGRYTISVVFTISGVVGGYDYGEYDLKEYSIYNVKNTVRVWSEPRTYSEKELIDYTNSNVKDCIRFNGFFGNRQPETAINNLITKGRVVEKVTRENLNVYTLRTDPIDIAITRRLIDFHFLNEDTLLLSDFNSSNHDYLIFDKKVVLEESSEIEYIDRSRWAKLTAKFGDRKKLDKSYYNEE